MVSVIIPAHNEEAVIGPCLQLLMQDSDEDLEIIVVCNGCRDATAAIARGFGNPVRVIETPLPSKAKALNLGDKAATSFPRLYMDADVRISSESVRELAAALERSPVLAASPGVDTVFPEGTSWAVRAYYRLWMALPYIQEGMMAAGAYALNRTGRNRFEAFPDVIADDGYIRLLFSPVERPEVPTARSVVAAPSNLRDLIKIKTRSRLGVEELKAKFPELFFRSRRGKQYLRAWATIVATPSLYACLAPYVWVYIRSRARAHRQMRQLTRYTWERDNSSRRHAAWRGNGGPAGLEPNDGAFSRARSAAARIDRQAKGDPD